MNQLIKISCWQDSGYEFSEVAIQKIGDKEVYTATLQKGQDQLYTAWWYENEHQHTPHEWTWRWGSLQGQGGYYMVNVSCEEKEQLHSIISQVEKFNSHSPRH